MKKVRKFSKKIDSVWFDSRIPNLRKIMSQALEHDSKMFVNMNPLFFNLKGNGLNPDNIRDEVKQVPIKDDEKWRKSFESNDRIIIRI